MPFLHVLPDPGMNYTLNRPLMDGLSPSRLKEISAVATNIRDYGSWHTVWLDLAKRAESEKRWLDAASYYHGAEFYLPAGDVRNRLYDDFARNWALGMEGVAGYERIAVPYPGGHLPGFRLQAKGTEQSTFIFHGGYDSFVEALVARERLPNSVFDWCVTQGMHITGTTTSYDFLTAIEKHSLDGTLHNVTQDILLTEGEQDHLFDVDWLYRTMRELVCARSVTARIFTAREAAEQHCQVGNSALAREEIIRWLSRFYPDMLPAAA